MKHVIKNMTMTCGACPTQWEGETTDGQFVYIRYRHGWFSCGIGATEDAAIMADTLVVEKQRRADGVMGWDEMQEITAELFDWSKMVVQP